MPKRSSHIPLVLLWAYSQRAEKLDTTYSRHLTSCEDCIAILLLGRTSDSIEDLENRLNNYVVGEWKSRAVGGRLDINGLHSSRRLNLNSSFQPSNNNTSNFQSVRTFSNWIRRLLF